MARGVNKVILVGNLGGDPDVRYTNSGNAITTISIATTESWKDKQTGDKQERTEWHRVKLFGKLGEIAGEYLTKGRQVYIEGSIRTDKYTDKEGVERYATSIVASEMQMLGGGGDHQQHAPRPASGGHTRSSRPASSSSTRPSAPTQEAPAQSDGFEDDDIPF